ncbi:MAG: DUF2147 domain-containing protein [Bacteroidetes bacterium]|nr:DUF2147 domain-containing protein [Bacteroidota bacterium]
MNPTSFLPGNRISLARRFLIPIIASAAAILFGGSFTTDPANSDAIVGVWKTGEGTAMVRIYKNGEKYQGRVVWLKEPNDPETGKPKVDKNHPEEASRTRPLLGLINVWGFVYKDNNTWDEGNIYDPKNGSTYSCTIRMTNPNTLEVRGYIGVSLIGRTDVWTRQVAK